MDQQAKARNPLWICAALLAASLGAHPVRSTGQVLAARAVGAAEPAVVHEGALLRLDGALRQSARHYPSLRGDVLHGLRALNPTVRFALLMSESTPRVLVDAVADKDLASLRIELARLGFIESATYRNDIGGWIPVSSLADAAQLTSLRLMRAARARIRSGVVTTQGDFAQRSDLVRASTTIAGLNGGGVTVGVLSDSFDCYAQYRTKGVPVSGAAGYAQNGFTAESTQDIASGDLPNDVNILEEGPCFDYDPTEQDPFGDEGRAMLQIVRDVAPNATLAFHTAVMSEADFAAGIIALAHAGAKIIADDVSYPDEPFFQDGLVAQAVDEVKGQGVAYFSAAGNEGRNSLEIRTPHFPVAAATGAANANEQLLNFDASGAGTTTTLPITIPELQPGQLINFIVEWDQPYVTGATGSPGSASSIDVCLTDAAGNILGCQGASVSGQDPVNILTWINPVSNGAPVAGMQAGLQIGLAGGVTPGLIKVVVADNGAGASINAFNTNSATLQGHSGAAGAMAVGAAFYLRTPRCGTTPAALDAYSSAGGDAILFDEKGNRLSTVVTRQKPDIVGPDGVNNTFLGAPGDNIGTSITACESNASYPLFFGTSAATPHIAAVAALLLQARPAASVDQLYTALRNSTSPMAAAGFDFDTGFGFIQADTALTQISAAVAGSAGATVAPASSSHGGGATDLLEILVLAALVRSRRRPHALGRA